MLLIYHQKRNRTCLKLNRKSASNILISLAFSYFLLHSFGYEIKNDRAGLKKQVTSLKAQLNEKIDKLILRSPSNGQFVAPRIADLKGSFLSLPSLLQYSLELIFLLMKLELHSSMS